MINQKYYIFGIISTSNTKFEERDEIGPPNNTQIHNRQLFWLGGCRISTKYGRINHKYRGEIDILNTHACPLTFPISVQALQYRVAGSTSYTDSNLFQHSKVYM